MDEVYRAYRIALTQVEDGGWRTRITHVRGKVAPLSATATADQGPECCLRQARNLIDRYIEFLEVSKPPSP